MVFVCVGFTACGNADDNGEGGYSSNPLVGTQGFTKSGSDSDGTQQQTDTYVFNADGIGTCTSVGWASFKQQKQAYNFKETFNYKIILTISNTGILVVTFISTEPRKIGEEYYWSFSIYDNTLRLNEGYGFGEDWKFRKRQKSSFS